MHDRPPDVNWKEGQSPGERAAVQATHRRGKILTILAVVVVLAMSLAWTFRWQAIVARSASGGGDVYLVNRLTGTVIFLRNGGADIVTPPAKPTP